MIYNYLKLIGVKRTIPYFGVMRLMQFLFDVKTIVFKMYLPIRFFGGGLLYSPTPKITYVQGHGRAKKKKRKEMQNKERR